LVTIGEALAAVKSSTLLGTITNTDVTLWVVMPVTVTRTFLLEVLWSLVLWCWDDDWSNWLRWWDSVHHWGIVHWLWDGRVDDHRAGVVSSVGHWDFGSVGHDDGTVIHVRHGGSIVA